MDRIFIFMHRTRLRRRLMVFSFFMGVIPFTLIAMIQETLRFVSRLPRAWCEYMCQSVVYPMAKVIGYAVQTWRQ